MIAGLIGLLAPRLGATFAKLIVYVGIPLLVIALIWWRVDAYGDSRFKQGETQTDAKWEAAVERLHEQARQSATKADDAAAIRLEQHVEQTTREMEAINEAEQNGSSPLDVLFGG